MTQETARTTSLLAEEGKIERASASDPLTSLPNRHVAEQWLAKEIAVSRRQEKSLTLLMLDVYDFRCLNDHQGRALGDTVLEEFAKRLRKVIRGSLRGEQVIVRRKSTLPDY